MTQEIDNYAMRSFTRIDEVSKTLDILLSNILDPTLKRDAFVHLYGAGQVATILFLKRGHAREECEIACIAAMLHDLCKYVCPDSMYDDHAHKCAVYAKEMVLDRIEGLSEEDKTDIYNAIERHDRKYEIDTPLDEAVKDADIFQRFLRRPMDDCFYHKSRVQTIIAELTKE